MRLDTNPLYRRRGWNEVARVLPEPFDIPRDACGGRQLSCGTSTYARDPTHDAGPGGTRRRSSARGPEEKFGAARNSRADHRSTRQEFFYCVTTHPLADTAVRYEAEQKAVVTRDEVVRRMAPLVRRLLKSGDLDAWTQPDRKDTQP